MDHASLFRYLDRHKYTYDPNDRPDYARQRLVGARQVIRYADVSVCDDSVGNVPGLWIRPGSVCEDGQCRPSAATSSRGKATILFMHGGAFVRGDRYTDLSFCCELVRRLGCNVYSTDYALAPEHPFPQGVVDCCNVYGALSRRLGSSNIVLCGESAGATMALAVANDAKSKGIGLPKGIVLISPCVQFQKGLPSHSLNLATDCMVTNFLEEAVSEYFQTDDPVVLSNPLASPLSGDFAGFPPVYITASDCEVLRDDSLALDEKMSSLGVDCTLDMAHGLMHVYPVMVQLEESRVALDRICSFLGRL